MRFTPASAMLRSGSAAGISALLSLIATKIFAAVLGPPGVAVLVTLQQTRQTALTAATANGQTALVRGASLPAARESIRSIAVIFAAGIAVVAGILALSPARIGLLTGLGTARAGLIRWVAVSVVFSGAYVFLGALLVALGSIGRAAMLQLISPALLAVFAYPAAVAVRSGQEAWFAVPAAFGALACAAFAALGLSRHRDALTRWFRGPGSWWSGLAVHQFFSISSSMLASGLAGSAAVLAVRSRMAAADGMTVTGQFDAAWGISVNQVSLVLASLQTYYLPELLRARTPAARSEVICSVARTMLAFAVPLLALVALLKPVLLALLYSPAFSEAARLLRWTLVGDFFKVSSALLSVLFLAEGDMKAFLTADLAAFVSFMAGAAVLPFGSRAEAAAAAFVLMYVVHLAVCGALAWWRHGFRPSREAIASWGVGLAGLMIVSALCWEAA